MWAGRGGALAFRNPAFGQDRYTRLQASTLGKGYALEDILPTIEGQTSPTGRHRVNLIVDFQSHMRAGKGPVYEQWTKIYNLKQMAAALQYLQENGLMEYADLEQQAAKAADRFHALSDSIKSTETAMRTNTELKTAIVDYAKTRPVFEDYKATKYSKKYLAEHEAEIAVYRAARATMDKLLNGGKLPKMDTLKTEYRQLAVDKKKAYREYRDA